jgi:uncharacterized protein (DUF488 family)
MTEKDQADRTIFSVGHSNHSMAEFLNLIQEFSINVLVDVRSHPYSQYAPHFNSPDLSRELKARTIKYLYLGGELGGRPEDECFYDDNGYVLYSEWSQSTLFLEGIERLERGVENHRIAMMCSEENPIECHRRLLITPILEGRGIKVMHIRRGGQLESETELLRQEAQATLFKSPEGVAWKSIRSVLQRKQPRNFSAS